MSFQKVIIIGSPGAGKSTFARKLRDITGLLNPALHIGRCPEQVTTFIIKLSHFRQMLTGNQQKLTYKKRG